MVAGLVVHLLFLVTVVQLYRFLDGTHGFGARGSLWWDVALAAQFAVLHSWLLLPATRRKLSRFMPAELYGLFFCAVTCISLWAAFVGWRASELVLIQFHGFSARAMQIGFWVSWGALIYSLALSGLGYQTGLTPWWYWMRGVAVPRRQFHERGAYRILRHPIYLSFAGLLWFSPTFTLDRGLLVAMWTGYIAVGSVLKDRRLEFFLGEEYREYARRVSGYPGVIWGPLARWPQPVASFEVPLPISSPATAFRGELPEPQVGALSRTIPQTLPGAPVSVGH
jgi:hypothetical protein